MKSRGRKKLSKLRKQDEEEEEGKKTGGWEFVKR